ncbi:hypothetical protein B0920_09635 [Massilia sp. KIM]|uniref:hypothetical protein n=1 Tax=Massilia sp. KIM TaxID=1955422 RepID=UPI00098FB485|nr:hypothetical protein [Massilia sp. KIM]OON63601.1 hypothetical protein B0920_09635 [Massilia sp. KIM]
MSEQSRNDARSDVSTAGRVEQGLAVCARHGLDPALTYMEQAGVPRDVALRVLCSPRYYRQADRRRQALPVPPGAPPRRAEDRQAPRAAL